MTNAPEIAELGKAWWWHQGAEDCCEVYSGSAPTRAEAETAARAEGEPDGEEVFCLIYGGKEKLSYDIFDFDHVHERFGEHNEEAWGDDGCECSATSAQQLDLERRLEVAFREWAAEVKPWSAWAVHTEHHEQLPHRVQPDERAA